MFNRFALGLDLILVFAFSETSMRSEKDRKTKVELMTWPDTFKWSAWAIAVGAVVLSAVLGTYIAFFKSHAFSGDPADWGVLGDFVGGIANPFLSFVTIVLLAMTIILQAKQLAISSSELRLSRQELELTRGELTRSALAQELSEKALRAQAAASEATAQLATINALMDYYTKEISRQKDSNFPIGDPRYVALLGLKKRHSVLQQRLEQFYVDLTGVDNE